MLKTIKKIYILDDNLDFCKQIKNLIKHLGEIFIFTDPKIFLNKIETETPDLVLVDLNLNHPKYNGFDIIKTIKKKIDSHLISIIMVSGEDSSDILSKAFHSGIEDYVHKPIMPNFFMQKINHVLYQSKIKLHTNALTGLPGILLIEEEYLKWINLNKPFSIAYLDLDQFKPFNDYKGVKAGDKAIQLLAHCFKEIRASYDKKQLYTGHLGGDDFFILGYKTVIRKFIGGVYKKYPDMIKNLFSKTEIENGFYKGKTRDGKIKEIPLITISTAVINIAPEAKNSFDLISKYAASVKKKAKSITGNSKVEINLTGIFEKNKNLFTEEQKKKEIITNIKIS
ncbi:MAG: response regulator [Spirochaetia bacterium]|nr:response regulator [Spirochaetia bacterium]